MSEPSPHLSIVVTSRNDDHGGDILHRMQLFIWGLLGQLDGCNLELVIVEWNPPPDKLRLRDALRWPDLARHCAVRIIEVPTQVHERFSHSDRIALFQMIAKNVGIRRARGNFILATNIDILFSKEMMMFFASGRLSHGKLYRVDRHDVPSDIPDNLSIDEQLAYCREHVIRVHARNGTRILRNGPRGLRELVKGARSALREIKRAIRGEEPPLHTNASGDFTLMAREHWFAVRGYAEFAMYSFWLDSLLCYAAHYAGANEEVLPDPLRIYHIEHALGSGWSPGRGGELLNQRLAAAGIPRLSGNQYNTWVDQMRKRRTPIIFNESEAWGLADENLPEATLTNGIER